MSNQYSQQARLSALAIRPTARSVVVRSVSWSAGRSAGRSVRRLRARRFEPAASWRRRPAVPIAAGLHLRDRTRRDTNGAYKHQQRETRQTANSPTERSHRRAHARSEPWGAIGPRACGRFWCLVGLTSPGDCRTCLGERREREQNAAHSSMSGAQKHQLSLGASGTRALLFLRLGISNLSPPVPPPAVVCRLDVDQTDQPPPVWSGRAEFADCGRPVWSALGSQIDRRRAVRSWSSTEKSVVLPIFASDWMAK